MFFEIKRFLRQIFSLYTVGAFLAVALVVLFIDLPRLRDKGFVRDITIARPIAIVYLLLPLGIYIVLKFI